MGEDAATGDDSGSGCYSAEGVIFRGGSGEEPVCEPSATRRRELPVCLLCDGEGRVQSWGADAERLVGIRGEEVVGKVLAEVLVPSRERFAAPVDVPPSAVVVCLNRIGMVPRTFLQTTLALPNPRQGSAILLWPEPASADGLSDAVSAIATRIGHDLWQMLSPVLGNVILLENERNVEVLRSRLGSIREATETARSFAQRLMSLDPKRKPTLDAGNLGRVVRDAMPAVRQSLSPTMVLREAIADVEGVRVSHKQIQQVLLQLVANAQEAVSGRGEVSIVVDTVQSTGSSVPAGSWGRLLVRDDGPGMEQSLLEHALEPFVSTKVPASGAGLGLPFVAAVGRQHGAIIDVESGLDQGTSVSLYFPRRAGEAEVVVALPPAENARAASQASGSILLVEDNPMVRRSVESTLRGMGYTVVAVDDGEQALAVLRAEPRRPLNLLVTDVMMPAMSGKELISRAHELRPELPVLFMSGYDRSTLASSKQTVVTQHFLQKPFDSQDLAQAVEGAIAAGKHDG